MTHNHIHDDAVTPCCYGNSRIVMPKPIEQQRAEWLAAVAAENDEETET